MADEIVVDASVVAKCFFNEEGSTAARAFVAGGGSALIAPDLIFAEVASVAAKYVRRGLIPRELGADAVTALGELLDEVVPMRDLAARAFQLAAEHGFSAYDSLYLALAEQRRTRMATADLKLVARAGVAGLSGLVMTP
jgi:predicted nucleic acid-binding protein